MAAVGTLDTGTGTRGVGFIDGECINCTCASPSCVMDSLTALAVGQGASKYGRDDRSMFESGQVDKSIVAALYVEPPAMVAHVNQTSTECWHLRSTGAGPGLWEAH